MQNTILGAREFLQSILLLNRVILHHGCTISRGKSRYGIHKEGRPRRYDRDGPPPPPPAREFAFGDRREGAKGGRLGSRSSRHGNVVRRYNKVARYLRTRARTKQISDYEADSPAFRDRGRPYGNSRRDRNTAT